MTLTVCKLLSSQVLTNLFLMFFTRLAKLFPHHFYCLSVILTFLRVEVYQVTSFTLQSQIIALNLARMVFSALQCALWNWDTGG